MGPGVPSSVVNIRDFNLTRNDRNVHGGGVALFTHESLTVKLIIKSDNKCTGKPGTVEYLMCEMRAFNSPPIFVAVVYRPPHASFTTPNGFGTTLSSAMDGYSHKIIG